MPKRETSIIEKHVRDYLAKRYGKIFPSDVKSRTLMIGKMPHRFDIVSEDKKIVGEIKSVGITTEKAFRTTRAKRVLTDCYFLDKVEAKEKILILTDEDFYNRFISDYETIVKPIKIMYINVEI
ncbi:MAG: hypothetical protein L6N95_00545 [Candidatus Methylarchaceae archaeon HK01B]|nr:hypothetical protein [Candidatus Methylarchaceae archaeon HK01B]